MSKEAKSNILSFLFILLTVACILGGIIVARAWYAPKAHLSNYDNKVFVRMSKGERIVFDEVHASVVVKGDNEKFFKVVCDGKPERAQAAQSPILDYGKDYFSLTVVLEEPKDLAIESDGGSIAFKFSSTQPFSFLLYPVVRDARWASAVMFFLIWFLGVLILSCFPIN